MSTGLVVCSACRREVHQDGPNDIEKGWRHCYDRSPRCAGATADYPENPEDVEGPICGRDGIPKGWKVTEAGELCEVLDEETGRRCERRAIKTVPGPDGTGLTRTCGRSHAPGARSSMRDRFTDRRVGGFGNLRNVLCPCGSGKKWKRCCGLGTIQR